jgi:hypothetical protein
MEGNFRSLYLINTAPVTIVLSIHMLTQMAQVSSVKILSFVSRTLSCTAHKNQLTKMCSLIIACLNYLNIFYTAIGVMFQLFSMSLFKPLPMWSSVLYCRCWWWVGEDCPSSPTFIASVLFPLFT